MHAEVTVTVAIDPADLALAKATREYYLALATNGLPDEQAAVIARDWHGAQLRQRYPERYGLGIQTTLAELTRDDVREIVNEALAEASRPVSLRTGR